MVKVKKIGILLLSGLLLGTTVLAWSAFKTRAVRIEKVERVDTLVLENPDPEKVKTLKAIYAQLSPSGDSFLLSGEINALNGADSSDRMEHVAYVFCKKASATYLQIGQTETLNTGEVNVFIDHGIRKIMLSKSSSSASPNLMPDLKLLLSQIREEGFKLTESQQGNSSTLMLRNLHHISCKEYAVSFNTSNLMPERFFMRLSNFQNPEDAKKDQRIDFKIKQLTHQVDFKTYLAKMPVEQHQNTWALTAAYQDYELINTL